MKIISVGKEKFLKEFPDTQEDIDNCTLFYSEEKGLGIIKYKDSSIISKLKPGFENNAFTQRDDFDLLIALTAGDYTEIQKEVEKNLYEIQAIEELEEDNPLDNGYPVESKVLKIQRIIYRSILVLSAVAIIYGTYLLSGLLNK